MEASLLQLSERLAKQPIVKFTAARIRQGVVLPVLGLLGWNPLGNTSAVYPEFPLSSGTKADFALIIKKQIHALLFVVGGSSRVEEERSRLYLNLKGSPIPIALLTNGSQWLCVTRTPKGEIADCGVLSFLGDNIEEGIKHLVALLAKENLASQEAFEYAQKLILPEQPVVTPLNPELMACDVAFKDIIAKSENLWIELISQELQLKGQKTPSKEVIREYLRTIAADGNRSLEERLKP